MKLQIKLTGTTPLLMHSSATVDPLNPAGQAIRALTSKRKKTDSDHLEIRRLEFMAGLYLDKDLGPFLPGEMIFQSLVGGGKLTRSGVKVTRGLLITTDINPLVYKGPREAEAMYKKEMHLVSPVRIGTARTMRCRPQIPVGWMAEAEALLDPATLSLPDLRSIAESAGAMVGIGDWRPRFGRYITDITEIK